jgi:hypothetical protein
MANANHDARGRFASGSNSAAGSGDHQAVSPRADVRNVSGRTVPRSKPVTRHGGVQSLGTDAPRLGRAAAERVALNRRVDEGHYPTETNADVGMKTALIGTRIAPGKLDPRLSTLVSGGPGKPRVRARAN